MKKEDWEKAKSRLRAPLGRVDLLCDGYSVTLVNECMVSAKGIQVTEVWQSCHRGQNLFNFSGGTLVGVQYAGSQYASDNILQGAGINSGSQYWAQCASDASVRFILAYY